MQIIKYINRGVIIECFHQSDKGIQINNKSTHKYTIWHVIIKILNNKNLRKMFFSLILNLSIRNYQNNFNLCCQKLVPVLTHGDQTEMCDVKSSDVHFFEDESMPTFFDVFFTPVKRWTLLSDYALRLFRQFLSFIFYMFLFKCNSQDRVKIYFINLVSDLCVCAHSK